MKISFSKYLFAFMVVGLIFTSCEEDPIDGGGVGGTEEISLEVTTTSPSSVSPNDTIYVSMNAKEGASPLNLITVSEDGTDLPLERVLFDGTSIANPLLLLGAEKVEFTKDVGVIVSGDSGTHTYNFKVTDDAGNAKGGDLAILVESTPPTFSIVGDGIRSQLPGDKIALKLMAEKGSVDLDQIRVDLNGVPLADFSELEYSGTDFTANPETLTGSNRMKLDGNLFVEVPSESGSYVLTVSIFDAAGNVASQDITLLVGTTPNEYMEAVFFNNAGSENGSMDLDNGMSVNQSSTESEIRDLGVDPTITIGSGENWFKKIEPVNGAAMAKLVPGMNNLAEGFTFESIQFAEDIIALVDNQTPLAEGNNTGAVGVGDMFLVSNSAATKVYVFIIREVNEVAGSNDDNYVIDIKTSL